MLAYRYEISLLVFNSTSHSFAVLTRELSYVTVEEKFHIYAPPPCVILYLKNRIYGIGLSLLLNFKWIKVDNF